MIGNFNNRVLKRTRKLYELAPVDSVKTLPETLSAIEREPRKMKTTDIANDPEA
jgi:hypothetical protein